jgi:hypothetical protein
MSVDNFFIRNDYGDTKVTIKWKISFESGEVGKRGGMGAWSQGVLCLSVIISAICGEYDFSPQISQIYTDETQIILC